jgi:branched-subunit amino acid ABC-type transport system permease component
MTAVTLFAYGLVKWTRTGAHMVATGEADEAARLAGIATGRMKRIGLLLTGSLRRHHGHAAGGRACPRPRPTWRATICSMRSPPCCSA